MARRCIDARFSLLLAAASAAFVGCFAVASHDEYDAYRRIRLQPDTLERMRTAQAYRQEYPDGVLSGKVSDLMEEMDDAGFAAAGRDTELLRLYLDVLPEGAHAAEARMIVEANVYFDEQRRAYEEAERERQRVFEEAERLRLEAEAEAREQWQERLRLFVQDGFRDWIMILGSLRHPWGKDLQTIQQENEVFFQYWASEPLPTCEADGSSCRKRYDAFFTIEATDGRRHDRPLALTVQLDFRENRFFRAAIYLDRDGFINWYELTTKEVNLEDAEQYVREIAVTYFVEYVNQLVSASFPGGDEIDPGDPRIAYSYKAGPIRVDILGLSQNVGRRIDGVQIVNESIAGPQGRARGRGGRAAEAPSEAAAPPPPSSDGTFIAPPSPAPTEQNPSPSP